MLQRGLLLLLLLCFYEVHAQNVCISADGAAADASAMLEISVASLPTAAKKGLLLPRMTRLQRDAIATPADGLLVYLTDAPGGFWYYDADIPTWVQWGAGPWRLTGNAGTDPTHHFVGTNDAQPFIIRANGATGMRITTLGQWVPENTGGSVIIGLDAAHGYASYATERNAFIGPSTGFGNGVTPSTAALNVAAGYSAAVYLATGNENAAVGHLAGRTNQFGSRNSFAGTGADILEVYDWNAHAGLTALGYTAEASTQATSIGVRTKAGMSTNGPANYHGATALGADARADTLNGAAMGSGTVVTTPHTVRIGNAVVNDIGGYAPWTDLSDIRFKQDVGELTQGMELISLLHPITYRMDRAQLDAHMRAAVAEHASDEQRDELLSGLSAQELEAALIRTGAPEGMVVQSKGAYGHYSVNYSALVPHLVKAIQEQDVANTKLATRIRVMEQRLNELKHTSR